jgi:hypothetical protein
MAVSGILPAICRRTDSTKDPGRRRQSFLCCMTYGLERATSNHTTTRKSRHRRPLPTHDWCCTIQRQQPCKYVKKLKTRPYMCLYKHTNDSRASEKANHSVRTSVEPTDPSLARSVRTTASTRTEARLTQEEHYSKKACEADTQHRVRRRSRPRENTTARKPAKPTRSAEFGASCRTFAQNIHSPQLQQN